MFQTRSCCIIYPRLFPNSRSGRTLVLAGTNTPLWCYRCGQPPSTSLLSTPVMICTARLISLLALVASLPLAEAAALDVWAPQILYPKSGTQWYAGEDHHVTWHVITFLYPVLAHIIPFAGIPATLLAASPTRTARYISSLAVRSFSVGHPSSSSRHRTSSRLSSDYQLASGFDIRDGRVQVHVPNVHTGEYQVVCKSPCISDAIV